MGSHETPPFGQMISHLFEQSNREQQAGILNHLSGRWSAASVGTALGGLSSLLQGSSTNRTISGGCDGDVKVLGVDDWAWHPGHRYGTVLVDLERRQPLTFLRIASETLAHWLRFHPTVRVISRDRAGAYAEGARQGAPDAIQVADRFHLFCNMTQALQRLLERLASLLQRVQLEEPAVSTYATVDPY